MNDPPADETAATFIPACPTSRGNVFAGILRALTGAVADIVSAKPAIPGVGFPMCHCTAPSMSCGLSNDYESGRKDDGYR